MATDPYAYFRVETREILDQLGKGILDLEKGSPEPELVQRLLRFAHTLKGAARVVRQKEIAEHAHAIEDALAAFREGGTTPSHARFDSVLTLLDAIEERVSKLGSPDAASKAETHSSPEESFRILRVDVEEMDALIDSVVETRVRLAALQREFDTIDRVHHVQELLVDQLRSPRVRQTAQGSPAKTMELAEELGDLLADLESNVQVGVEQMDRELRHIRETAERLRLLPVGLMFNVLERTARDVALSVGKTISLATRGGDVRLDTHVLGIVQNALVQVVRNAVAHGIESGAERTAAGKPPEGKVILEVVRRGNRVSFTCRDDGRGIDLDAVRRRAQRKGLLSAEAEKRGPEELIRLLLQGGISTSGTVTEISGRGVGLDVVRAAASRLGGDVHIRTEASRGTTIEIVVPVSLTSVDGLLVQAGTQTVVIPLDAVRESLRVSADQVAHTADGESIVLHGKVIPFVPLTRLLQATAPTTLPTAMSQEIWSAVVLENGGVYAAMGVDRLLGTQNVVLSPLPRLCTPAPVVAGASWDVEGNPQLVLDPEVLVTDAHRNSVSTHVATPQLLPILIIDDSLTTRMLEQSILESAGYEVDVAISGEEGLRKAHQRRYALFLVDVEMPGIDGFEFIRRVREDPNVADIPAILVTSRGAPEDRQRGAEVGARAYIDKNNFDQAELLGRIRTLVGG